MASNESESEPQSIARALRSGDADGISRLVAQFHYRLLRYLVYLTGRREQAEDLVQETWIRVLERAGQYNGRSRFEPWLFSIARNLAIDHLRKHADVEAAEVLESGVSDQSPFQAAARSEDAGRIAAAMDRLEPIYREALLLRFQEDLTLDEISKVTAAPVPTVSSRIQRGLAILRSRLKGVSDAI